jgi:catechol 2,3-dioxygenase-like lactoylglutathione lyase family enzyme
MTPLLRLDHIVIRVNDLDRAMDDYRSLGFTVAHGGEHPSWGSRNALIAFQDDTYLELIDFPGQEAPGQRMEWRDRRSRELRAAGRTPVECRVLAWACAPEGLVDYALVPRVMKTVLTRAKAPGFFYDGPFPGSRVRPDGKKVAWRLAVPNGYDLPFLCADVTTRSLRVPRGKARNHANGATGISRVMVKVRDLPDSVGCYRRLLARRPLRLPEDRDILFARDFKLGATYIQLDECLSTECQGPWAVGLRPPKPLSEGGFNRQLLHKASIGFDTPETIAQIAAASKKQS